MTIGGSGQASGEAPQVSGTVTAVLLRHVRAAAGDRGVARTLAASGVGQQASDLEDPSTWVTHDDAISLLAAAAEVTGDAELARHVGQSMISEHLGTEGGDRLRAIGSPGELIRRLAGAAGALGTVSVMQCLDTGPDHADLRSCAAPGVDRHRYLCDLTKGMLAEVPVLFGLAPALVGEPECQARGGRFCVYHARWRGAGEIEELRARVDDLSAQLAGAHDTADALLRFSRSLAGLATARDVAAALAGAVAVLAGGDSSSVLLWDPLDEQLRVEARAPVAAGPGAGSGAATATRLETLGTADPAPGAAEPELHSGALRRSPVAAALMGASETAVVDHSTQDAFVATLLDRHGCEAAVLFPLRCGDEFLGLVTSEYEKAPVGDPRSDAELRVRLAGLADLAVIALQNASLMEQMGDQALHDTLTGLPNRRLLTDRVDQELGGTGRRDGSPTLLYLDVDRMQRVNEALGHAAGDELIRQVAHRLRETVREQDTVARLGSDKLAVLLVAMSERTAVAEMAGRILDALREPHVVAGVEIFTSASMGIAVAPRDGSTYETLLASATEAGRRSKVNGRNTATFASDVDDRTRADAELQADLRLALGRDELFVLYQPYIDLETTRVVGVEALVRWKHPARGVLEPGAFIVEAEESDLIVGVDLFVLREACRQMRQWADEGVTPMRVSVNISGRDLAHPGFVSSVSAALRDHDVPPEQLELEITERVVGDEEGVMQRAAGQLRDLGVRISLDDFGAGSASLQQLAAFPVTTIKIDRSFLQLLGPPDQLGSLATAIIELAAQLGLHCVAEGVETSRQSRILLQRGCTTAQGFFFSPPLLPTDVKRMLQSPMRPGGGSVVDPDGPPSRNGAPGHPRST